MDSPCDEPGDDKALSASKDWSLVLDQIDMLHPVVRILLRYRQMIRLAIAGTGIYSVVVGLGTYFGGGERLSGPNWSIAVDFADAASTAPTVFWGISAVAFGVLVLVPIRKVSMCGLFGVIAWSTFLALSHLISVNLQPLASVSGIYTHAFVALIVTSLFTVQMIDRKI